jgi:hypothetical protein
VIGPSSLLDRWRADATALRRRGATGFAQLLEGCAEELEAWLQGRESEVLGLPEASEESGYSQEHLRRLVREGILPDVATDGPIRVRRGDLPRKPRARNGRTQ